MISYGKQSIDQKDILSVSRVLKGNIITQGKEIQKFENLINDKFGSKYSCAVSSGTAALYLSGMALNWKANDIVLTTPITFVATANCIVHAGATPDFVDINSKNYTIDLNSLEDKIKFYKKKNTKIKAVIGVDYAGHPCDWESLRYLSNKYNFTLINDNCHALGSEYKGNKKYAIKYADLVTHSYHPVKHITTGEGGNILTNDKKIYQRLKSLRSHGIFRSNNLQFKKGLWYYEMRDLGYNFRITDFQCALGASQLGRLDKYVNLRKRVADLYNKSFNKIEFLTVPVTNDSTKHSYHLYPLLINFKKLRITKKQLFISFLKKGIQLQVHYIPIYKQPYYKKNYFYKLKNFPNANLFYEKEVSLPIYPLLKKKNIDYIIKNILALDKFKI